MKLLRISLLFAIPAMLLFSCHSVQIVADYDGDVNFKQYETYMILPWRPENSEYVNQIDQRRFYAALENEMNARGYKKVDSKADLAVNILVLIEEKKAYSAYRDYYGGYGYYYPFGYGYSTTRYESFEVLQGTLLVDVFDHEKKKLIFQGSAIAEIKPENRNREKAINRVMSKIFWEYPVQKQRK